MTRGQLAALATRALAHGYYADPGGGLRVRCPLCTGQPAGQREYGWVNTRPGQPWSRTDPATGRRQRFTRETITGALRRIILAHLAEDHAGECGIDHT